MAAAAAATAAKLAERASRRLFIGGNWKCNGTLKSSESLVRDVVNKIVFDPKKIELLVSPVFVHLFSVKRLLNPKVHLSAQNISAYPNGPFTGEITAEQLRDFGIHWTLIGHSERRQYFKETDNVPALPRCRSSPPRSATPSSMESTSSFASAKSWTNVRAARPSTSVSPK